MSDASVLPTVVAVAISTVVGMAVAGFIFVVGFSLGMHTQAKGKKTDAGK